MNKIQLYQGTTIPTTETLPADCLYFNTITKTVFLNTNNTIVEFGKSERQAVVMFSIVSFIGEEEITSRYTFEHGMTWSEFIDSPYNVDCWINEGWGITHTSGVVWKSNSYALPQDEIIPNGTYRWGSE